jgi:hypothetical protein
MSKRMTAVIAVLLVLAASAGFAGLLRAQEFGVNWSVTFFPTRDLTGACPAGAVCTATGIPGINFNWGSGPAIVNGITMLNGQVNDFSARFTSSQGLVPGTYTFTVTADDGVRVRINGQTRVDRFVQGPPVTDTFTEVVTTTPVLIEVDYVEYNQTALIQVQWALTAPGVTGTPGITPTFGPSPTPGPTATPAPTGLPPIPPGAITGTVIRASVLNVRAGPSVLTDRIGQVRRGQTYQIIGRDERARWFLLQLSDRQGWVLGYYLYIPQNEFSAPVVSDFLLTGNPAAYSPTGVVAQSFATVRLRRLPTIYAEQIGRITWGGAVGVVARDPSGEWWQVVWKDTLGWVASSYFRIVEGNLNSVPVVQP